MLLIRRSLSIPVLIVLGVSSLIVAGEPPTAEAVRAAQNWRDVHSKMYLTVQRKNGGHPSKKEITVYLRQTDVGQDLFMMFDKPGNMKGTAFLAITRADRADEWYMYVRTLRRVKRVPTASTNFMLRDFLSLYLLKPRTELWDFQPGGTVAQGEGKPDLWALDGRARDARTVEMTGYGRIVHHIDPARNAIMKTLFYDDKGTLIRTQEVFEHRQFGDVLLPVRYRTDDLQEDVSATAELFDTTVDAGVPAGVFEPRYLKTL